MSLSCPWNLNVGEAVNVEPVGAGRFRLLDAPSSFAGEVVYGLFGPQRSGASERP